jgi:hypothetical protein
MFSYFYSQDTSFALVASLRLRRRNRDPGIPDSLSSLKPARSPVNLDTGDAFQAFRVGARHVPPRQKLVLQDWPIPIFPKLESNVQATWLSSSLSALALAISSLPRRSHAIARGRMRPCDGCQKRSASQLTQPLPATITASSLNSL